MRRRSGGVVVRRASRVGGQYRPKINWENQENSRNVMKTKGEPRVIAALRRDRNEAAQHLEWMEIQQQSGGQFIPAVAHAIVIELADFIERTNERIEKLEDEFHPDDSRCYIQSAFAFLCEVTIREYELPL